MKSTKSKEPTTLAELRAATKQYDKEIPWESTEPLSSEERKEWNRVRRGAAARRKLRKDKTIAVRVDADLLKQSDAYATEHGMTRDELINRGLKGALTILG